MTPPEWRLHEALHRPNEFGRVYDLGEPGRTEWHSDMTTPNPTREPRVGCRDAV